jgi:tetratricopeptide (TPR) repeat protein
MLLLPKQVNESTYHQLDESIAELKELIRINPAHAGAHYELAVILRVLSGNLNKPMSEEKKKDMNQLIMQHLDKAIEILPNYLHALSLKAEILMDLGKREEAQEFYEKVINVQETDLNARLMLAHLYEEKGNENKLSKMLIISFFFFYFLFSFLFFR